MLLRERVSDHAYIFRSNLYAQVNAGLITTNDGCVLVDTLPFPQETAEIQRFVRERLHSEVRYIILTHSHADHVYGAFLFPRAEVVGHLLSRELMIKHTRPALTEARKKNAVLANVFLRLPTLLTEDEAAIRIGGTTLNLRHSPGHSPDVLTVYFKDEKLLFASDTIMPIPFFANGNIDDLRRSLRAILEIPRLEDVVQGHGPVLLRGEVKDVLAEQLDYLNQVEAHVEQVLANHGGKAELNALSTEDCGIPPTVLDGLVLKLHLANMATLYAKRRKQLQKAAA
ncbi:MAG: MBL fold metallo-hydrolase [Chloroflexi bacterium]|nr:MBL fold metallo-hydrolase [Chloroflexota bacterium]